MGIPLKIGFDAKRLFLNKSGLGNYSRWLVKALSDRFVENEYHLYTTAISEFKNTFNSPNIFFHQPLGLIKGFWRTKTIKKDLIRDGIDIYHGLSNEIPYGIEKTKIKTVVTIHDLIFKNHPEFYNPIDVIIYDKKFKSACKRADRIVAISNYTKNQIIKFYKINPDKIDVIYLDSPKIYYNKPGYSEVEVIKNKYEINSPFLLNVGAIGGRKNQFRILEAFSEISDKIDLNLVFAGKSNPSADLLLENIKKYQLENRCKIIPDISDDNLHKLYHASYATVYPSITEGFGIPIIESYRSNKPVITSKGTSLEEIAGSSALLCNPLDTKSISDNMLRICNDIVYQNLIDKIPGELARFSTENTIDKYISLYKSL